MRRASQVTGSPNASNSTYLTPGPETPSNTPIEAPPPGPRILYSSIVEPCLPASAQSRHKRPPDSVLGTIRSEVETLALSDATMYITTSSAVCGKIQGAQRIHQIIWHLLELLAQVQSQESGFSLLVHVHAPLEKPANSNGSASTP
ncbi:hypothetical protein BS47DRAFT_327842 [Hydnum rufescens UP504]|uniref:Uncharacterized protein n=1 Tax=Hydnum rufescens UP504 TaxID=1448309 RepID=A0A9P6B5Q2_9AGAM|nr:hypothetical protein BS47DRAFT_327842 [Hydnum rufescens UP504]